MDTSLQSTGLTEGEVNSSLDVHADAQGDEAGHHIHMPGPSYWPFILSLAVICTLTGLLFIPQNPWLTIIAAPFVLIGILGWGLEDPMAVGHSKEGVENYQPEVTPEQVLEMAQETVDRVVTISSTAY